MGTMQEGIERVKKESEVGKLLEQIEGGNDTVKDLAVVYGLTAQTMRYHLNRLRDKKLVKIRNEGSGGRTTYWQLTRDGRKALRRFRGEPEPEPGDSGKQEDKVVAVAEEAEVQMPASRIDEIKAMLEEESQRLRVERLFEVVQQIEEQMPGWAKEHEVVRLRVYHGSAAEAQQLFDADIKLVY